MKIIYLLSGFLFLIACESPEGETQPTPTSITNESATSSNLWFGYYQENRSNNPEDPESDLVYLSIPNNGTFAGELFFAYNGCDGGFDAGYIEGDISGAILSGNWEGTVDGLAVGGPYSGQLAPNTTIPRYEGVYDNNNGKQEIDCDEDFSYYVAAFGDWFITKSNNDDAMDIRAEISGDDIVFNLAQISNVAAYKFAVIDQKCLEGQLSLETCLAWGGTTTQSEITYGQGGDLSAADLVKDKDYVLAAIAIGATGEVLAASSKEFRLRD